MSASELNPQNAHTATTTAAADMETMAAPCRMCMTFAWDRRPAGWMSPSSTSMATSAKVSPTICTLSTTVCQV